MSVVIAVVVLIVLLAAAAWTGIKLWGATALARRPRHVRLHTDDDFLTGYSRLLGLPQKRNGPTGRP